MMGFDPTAIAKIFADAQAGPPASAKQQLDAYRALNNGALPPGMTPEQALAIDFGIAPEMLLANPGLIAQLQQIAASRASTQQDFAAARQQVGDNYQQLTGDVEEQGKAYMADIMQRMGITPEQATHDPTLTGYGETIANMSETADQNQATDQAWFDKMAQVYDQQLAGIGTSLLAPPALTGGGGGGGGGGGRGGGFRRGGRGYGGGGSGGGDGGWKDPKTTDALVQSADVKALQNYPGYSADVIGMFSSPEEIEFAKRVMDTAGGLPHNVAKRVAGIEIQTAEGLNDTLLAQQAQNRLYNDTLPVRVSETADDFKELTPEQLALLSLQDQEAYGTNQNIARLANSPARPVGAGPNNSWFGPDSALQALSGRNSTSKRWGSRTADPYLASELQREKDKAEWIAARDAASPNNEFSFSEWEGYVPEIDEEELAENRWQLNILQRILDKTREYSPNYDMQVTQQTMQDSSDTKTTQQSQDPSNDLFNNNEIDMEAPAISNGVLPGFGASRGFGNLTESAQRILANRLKKVEERAQQVAPAQDAGPFTGGTRPSKSSPARPTGMRPAKPITPVKPKEVPASNLFSIGWNNKKPKPVKKATSNSIFGKDKSKSKPAKKKPPAKKRSSSTLIRY